MGVKPSRDSERLRWKPRSWQALYLLSTGDLGLLTRETNRWQLTVCDFAISILLAHLEFHPMISLVRFNLALSQSVTCCHLFISRVNKMYQITSLLMGVHFANGELFCELFQDFFCRQFAGRIDGGCIPNDLCWGDLKKFLLFSDWVNCGFHVKISSLKKGFYVSGRNIKSKFSWI